MDQRDLLLRYFFNRTDAVAVLAHWGKPCPVDAIGKLELLIEGHLRGKNAQPFSVYRLDEGHENEQLRGPFRIGSYAPDSDGNTPWLCIDIDGPPHDNAVADPEGATLRIKSAFESRGIPVYTEVSGSGTGRHLWVFCEPKVPAAKLRRLAFALIPHDIPLVSEVFADPKTSKGIEVFPKHDQIAADGYGSMVWLPCWHGAKSGTCQFYTLSTDGQLLAYTPESFQTIDEETVDAILKSCGAQATEPRRLKQSYPDPVSDVWDDWRRQVSGAVPLDAVYGKWLTGRRRNSGWLECRVPWSQSGDKHPSGGVADGSGPAPRGVFHDFISQETISVFDFLVRVDEATDFADARRLVAELTGIAQPCGGRADNGVDTGSKSGVKEQGVDPHRLARRFLEKRCRRDGVATLRFWRHEWWRWNGTSYRTIDAEELRAELTAFVKAELDAWCLRYTPDEAASKVSKHLIANTLQALTGMVIVPGDICQPAWLDGIDFGLCLSMSNGLIHLDGLIELGRTTLRPHSPSWFSSVHLPYDYDPAAKSPRWIGFLDQMLEKDSDRILMLQEWFGYCLTPDTSQQKFLMMEGEGSNGKSVICKLLGGLLGIENVSHVPLEMFGQRFQLAGTLGMLANIASEVGELDRAAEGILKAFVAGDRMYFDRKGIPGVQATPTARLVLATNNRPRFTDRSSGLWRRMLLLPMSVRIPEEDQDPTLEAKLLEELPGIFNWAIDGLRRLLSSRRFTVPAVCAEALEEYRAESNPARLYLQEHVEVDRSQSVPCQELYQKYRAWCDGRGYHPLGERMFGKEVLRVFPGAKRTRPGSREQREYHYQGLFVS